ncbi:hypothetical protein [Paraburkholderia kirstenboschensis]|uniref:hypothetical protein n=1 Tax=Paraburkholderia kirstenboschensis TaxID=1245436 RepID=UPI002E2879BE|nr:hypothetical protein [Paraburkholderia kirstenboschensis]
MDADPYVAVHFGVSLDTDPEQARDLLLGAYHAHPSILDHPAPSVIFSQLTPDGITLSVTGYVRGPRITGDIKSDLLFEILNRLGAAKIPLSKPQTVMVGRLHDQSRAAFATTTSLLLRSSEQE